MELKGRTVNPGKAEGEAIVSHTPFSFVGEYDPFGGKVTVVGHELEGKSLASKVLVCPTGKGSSAGPSIAWMAKREGHAPKAIICTRVEPIIALAGLTIDVPMVDMLDKDPVEVISTGDYLKVDATNGIVEVVGK